MISGQCSQFMRPGMVFFRGYKIETFVEYWLNETTRKISLKSWKVHGKTSQRYRLQMKVSNVPKRRALVWKPHQI